MTSKKLYVFIICNNGEFMIRPFINNIVHKNKYCGQIVRDIDYIQEYLESKRYKFDIYSITSTVSYPDLCNIIIDNLHTPMLISGARKIDTLEGYLNKQGSRCTIFNNTTSLNFSRHTNKNKEYICCPILDIQNRDIY